MRRLLPLVLLAACAAPPPPGSANAPIGYTDTPRLPDGWHVHDPDRLPPPAVDTTQDTRDLLRAPPHGAIVLFDGHGLDAWAAEDGGPARWKPVGDAIEVNGTGTVHTLQSFGDCELHIEWRTPDAVQGDSQARGNSGVFLMGRYEVQVLDSFDNRTYADGQAGALYGQTPPLVNACRPPGQWQSYDIVFHAPRFENGALVAPAHVTVRQNGVLVQRDTTILGATVHRALASYAPHDSQAPLALQDHGDPVRYRNIWIRPLNAH